MSMIGQPSPRQGHSAVWTGKVMIIWGGNIGATAQASGGIYDPEKDSWAPTVDDAAATPWEASFDEKPLDTAESAVAGVVIQ